jgi:hypothetical protein
VDLLLPLRCLEQKSKLLFPNLARRFIRLHLTHPVDGVWRTLQGPFGFALFRSSEAPAAAKPRFGR